MRSPARRSRCAWRSASVALAWRERGRGSPGRVTAHAPRGSGTTWMHCSDMWFLGPGGGHRKGSAGPHPLGQILAQQTTPPDRMSSASGAPSRSGRDLTLGTYVSSVTPLPARRRTHPPRARVAEVLDAERARVRAWLHDTLLQQLE